MLGSVHWQSVTDVSGQPTGPVFKGQLDSLSWDQQNVPKRQ